MTSSASHAHYSLDDYLRLEEYSNVKHEYLDGQIYAMAGGTPEHAAMAVRIAAALVEQLRGRPRNVYSSDLRVRVTSTGLDTYPDLSVVCGEEMRDQQDPNAIINPVVVVEVLSASTEEYDRGEKLEHYKKIPSVGEVVLVSHDQPLIDVWRRSSSGAWELHQARSGKAARLLSVDCMLDVDAVYRDPLAGSRGRTT